MKDGNVMIAVCSTLFIIVISIVLTVLLSGCAPNQTINDNSQLRDKNFTQGCQITQGNLSFDSYFDTTIGKATTCVLRCSPVLPENFSYKYDNPMTGCSVEIVK